MKQKRISPINDNFDNFYSGARSRDIKRFNYVEISFN